MAVSWISGQKDIRKLISLVWADDTHNASISVYTLSAIAINMKVPQGIAQHTFHHVLGLLNAFADFGFVLNVSFGGEGFM